MEFLAVLQDAQAALGEQAAGWRLAPDADSRGFWVTARRDRSAPPSQGWKLHLAAAVQTAEAVAGRTLPLLFQEDADFKIVASARGLAELNDGRHGMSQVGKFITVYPNDDEHAVRLAAAIDAATRELRGPAIPSDRPLRPQGVVHYRYGGFAGPLLRTPVGEALPSIRSPDGTLVPDRRPATYYQPPWVQDPFLAAGIAQALPAPRRRMAGRYVTVATLHRSPRSTVHLCFDVEGVRRCVVKRVVEDGSDSMARLRREADVLRRLAPDDRFPNLLDLLEDGDEVFLVMEDMEGQTAEQYLHSLKLQNRLPPRRDVLRWGRDVAAILDAIHARGLVYGDLKPSNVIIAPDGRLRLLDFELARERHEAAGCGSQGYLSPQQAAGRPAEFTDDVYSLGAFLYVMATGVEASRAPNPFRLLDRPVERLHLAMGGGVAQVIARCLESDPARRFPTPAEVATALESVADTPAVPAVPIGDEPEAVARERSLQLAHQVGDLLAEHARTALSTDLNVGAAGAIVVLAALDKPCHSEALAAGVERLATAPRPAGLPAAGLYVGEAGIAAAQLRAGQALGDDTLVDAALGRGRWIASLPFGSPDLFNGTAGRLRLHLWLWQHTAEPEPLAHAVAAAEHLLAAAEHDGGDMRWRIPPGFDSLSGRAMPGYAHGAAGIADALLDAFEVTQDGRFLDAAQGAGHWLERLAHPALEDGEGRTWPTEEDGDSTMAFWCHGAAGIVRLLLRLGATDVARRGAYVAARGARWAEATQCHGLSGNIECLLDVYQATGDESYLREARSLERLLHPFVPEPGSDSELASNPGFTVGAAGVAACLLRLAAPDTRPHLLSLRGFAEPSSVLVAPNHISGG